MKFRGITIQTKPFRQYFHKDVSYEGLNPVMWPSEWLQLSHKMEFGIFIQLDFGVS